MTTTTYVEYTFTCDNCNKTKPVSQLADEWICRKCKNKEIFYKSLEIAKQNKED